MPLWKQYSHEYLKVTWKIITFCLEANSMVLYLVEKKSIMGQNEKQDSSYTFLKYTHIDHSRHLEKFIPNC